MAWSDTRVANTWAPDVSCDSAAPSVGTAMGVEAVAAAPLAAVPPPSPAGDLSPRPPVALEGPAPMAGTTTGGSHCAPRGGNVAVEAVAPVRGASGLGTRLASSSPPLPAPATRISEAFLASRARDRLLPVSGRAHIATALAPAPAPGAALGEALTHEGTVTTPKELADDASEAALGWRANCALGMPTIGASPSGESSLQCAASLSTADGSVRARMRDTRGDL